MHRASSTRTVVATLLLSVVLLLPAVASQGVRVADSSFDWTDIEEERALFQWSADVVNEQARELQVRVSLLLLDGDDETVCWDQDGARRCARESVEITLQPSQARSVQHQGSMPYEHAAEVVSWRVRVDPIRPERP